MSGAMKVPFLDLVTPHAELKEELCKVFETALETAGFIGGPMVQGFEEDFARYCDTSYCVGVGSGTDALRFALIAAGVGPGDAVVTVPNTFIATTEAISQAGARIVFVDIDEATYNLDPKKLREHLETECDVDAATGHLIDRKTKGTVKAVIPVHLYGQMADMDPILELAAKYNLIVIEDACQVHSRIDGSRCSVQLLPGQEPRCLRRSRSRDHQKFRVGPTSPNSPGSWPSQEVLPRRRRLQRAFRFDPGWDPQGEASPSFNVDRSTPGLCQALSQLAYRGQSRDYTPSCSGLVAAGLSPVCCASGGQGGVPE
jgi:hypothetical protein